MKLEKIILKIKIIAFIILSTSLLQAKDSINLKILATTDIHGNMFNYDYYQGKIDNRIGLNRIASLVKEYRKDIKNNVILVDNGDLIQGSPFSDYAMTIDLKKQKHPIIKAMEYMQYDVINIGNHEFNYGLDNLDNIIKQSKIPFISANVYDVTTNKPKFMQYIILNKEVVSNSGKKSNIKIALIGVLPPQIMLWDKNKLENKVEVHDIVFEANNIIKKLKKENKVDLIGVLSHSGITESPYKNKMENAVVELTKNKNINFIVAGHDHGSFPKEDMPSYIDSTLVNNKKGTIRNIPVVMASSWGEYLGVIDLTLEKNNNKFQITKAKTYLEKPKAEDAQFNKLLKKEHQATIAYLNKPIESTEKGQSLAEVKKNLANYFAVIYPDFATNITNQAIGDYIKNVFVKSNPQYNNIPILSATAVFKYGGRGGSNNYTVVNKGGLSIKSINDIYSFNNTLVILKVTGKELKELLEWGSQIYNTIDPNLKTSQELINDNFRSYNFDIVGTNLTYDINPTKAARYQGVILVNKNINRIENLKYKGKVVKDSDIFLLGTSDYRANTNNIINHNGKNMVLETAVEYREILINYIKNKKTLDNKIEDSWSLVLGDGVKVNFLSSIKAKNLIKQDKITNITLIKDEKNGYGLFEYISEK